MVILILLVLCGQQTVAQTTVAPKDVASMKQLMDAHSSGNPSQVLNLIDNWIETYRVQQQTGLSDWAVYYKAKCLILQNESEDAAALINKLIPNSNKILEAHALKELAEIEFHNGRFFASTLKIRAAMELAKGLQDQELLAQLQESLAKVFDKVSKPEKAIQFYTRSMQLFQKLGRQEAVQQNMLALGKIYLSLEQWDSCILFLNRSLELAIQLGKSRYILDTKVELGNYYFASKKYNDLKTCLDELEHIPNVPDDVFLKVKLHVLKGNLLMAQKNEEFALQAYQKAEALSHQGFTPFIDSYIKSNLAEAYYRTGNVEKAYNLLRYLDHNKASYSSLKNNKLADSVALDSELGIRDREIDYLKLQNQLKSERITREVLLQQSLRRESMLKDHNLEKEFLLTEAAVREAELKEVQLEKEKNLSQVLSRESELRLSNWKKSQNILFILIAGLVLLVSLGTLIYYLLKKQIEKNRIIEQQKKDLEFINKEVHHRVKNNLQVISSLLDLQTKYAQDKRYENLLKESKNRVQSMAFIHQNLYESAGMNMVDMPNYVESLIDHLKTAYQKEDEQVQIHVQIEPLQLHMDLVVSIGMIINELVTNSLKYGFVGRKEGKIDVRLIPLNGSYELIVSDNGNGIPDEVNIRQSNTFGFKMIRAFVQKLKGQMNVSGERGTCVSIVFKGK